jgi:type III pantothenate kinase
MVQRILTIDLGNSRAKLALLETSWANAAACVGEATLASGPDLVRDVDDWLTHSPRATIALLSSVAALELEDALASSLTARFGTAFRRNPAVGLAIDYEPQGSLGRDRLYAARGAVQVARGSALVVDAGTALTVDAVVADEKPRFAGGAIAPGPSLLAEALHRGTARLPLVAPRTGVPALGRDTHGALLAGVVVGFRGAAAELARRVAEEAGLPRTAPVVVTGGARALLLEPDACFGARRVIEDALLVHKGLLAALADST